MSLTIKYIAIKIIENNIRIPVPDMMPMKKAELELFLITLVDRFPRIKPKRR